MPVKLIASFKRMRRFKDHATIVAALKESEFMEVGGDEGDEIIKRKDALDLERTTKDADLNIANGDKVRTVHDKALLTSMYAVCGHYFRPLRTPMYLTWSLITAQKGFGEETPTTQIDVEKLVEPYGPINCVRLRRVANNNIFKGSVFIEFANEELLKKFAAMEIKPTFNGQELQWKTKADYVKQKAEDIAAGRIKPSRRPNIRRFSAFNEERQKQREQGGNRGGRGGHRDGRGGRGGGRGGRSGRGRGGSRGGRGGFRDRNAEKNGTEAAATDKNGVPQLQDTDKNGVPQLQDAPATSTKRKADDTGAADRETKKPKEVASI